MCADKQAKIVMAIIMLAWFLPLIIFMVIENTKEFYTTQGIIEYAGDNTLTINNKVHDIKGVSVLDINGKTISKRDDVLRGKVAMIQYYEEKLVFVRILSKSKDRNKYFYINHMAMK